MAHARKMVRKNKVEIMSDANQRSKAHAALLKKKEKYAQLVYNRRMEEYRKMQEEKKAREAQLVGAAAAGDAEAPTPVADAANA